LDVPLDPNAVRRLVAEAGVGRRLSSRQADAMVEVLAASAHVLNSATSVEPAPVFGSTVSVAIHVVASIS
jgi:hypothetical protein